MDDVFEARLAGHQVRYAFRYPKTGQYFFPRLERCDGTADILAREEDIARAHKLIPEENAEDYAEFKALISCTARFLLRWKCTLFHAVALLFRGKAWLLTAPSGTGKTTQFMNWRKLLPAEITMISGDMPVIEDCADGSIRVYPSYWNGKEGLGSILSAPMGGIVLLEQGGENSMAPLSPREAIEGLFSQFAYVPETENEIRALCRLLDAMLRRVPVWRLTNKGDLASTELLRKTLAGGTDETI